MEDGTDPAGYATWMLDSQPDYSALPFNASRGTNEDFLARRSCEELAHLESQANQVMEMGQLNISSELNMGHGMGCVPSTFGSPSPRVAAPPVDTRTPPVRQLDTAFRPRVRRLTTSTQDVVVDGEVLTMGPQVAGEVADSMLANALADEEVQELDRLQTRVPVMRNLSGQDLQDFQASARLAESQTQADHATWSAEQPIPAPRPTALDVRLNYHKRPRGAAPRGKKWNHGTGDWVDAATELPNYVDPAKHAKRSRDKATARGDIYNLCGGIVSLLSLTMLVDH